MEMRPIMLGSGIFAILSKPAMLEFTASMLDKRGYKNMAGELIRLGLPPKWVMSAWWFDAFSYWPMLGATIEVRQDLYPSILLPVWDEEPKSNV